MDNPIAALSRENESLDYRLLHREREVEVLRAWERIHKQLARFLAQENRDAARAERRAAAATRKP